MCVCVFPLDPVMFMFVYLAGYRAQTVLLECLSVGSWLVKYSLEKCVCQTYGRNGFWLKNDNNSFICCPSNGEVESR